MGRRTFVKVGCIGSASVLVQSLDPMVRGEKVPPAAPPIDLHGIPDYKPSPLGMPGLFPGRVVEVRDRNAIVRNRVSQPIVRRLLEQAMKELTGERSACDAWATFIARNDVGGIRID